jgi:hypothetical protein
MLKEMPETLASPCFDAVDKVALCVQGEIETARLHDTSRQFTAS